jgi:hypothetical protein
VSVAQSQSNLVELKSNATGRLSRLMSTSAESGVAVPAGRPM